MVVTMAGMALKSETDLDVSVVTAARAGDAEAFAELVRRQVPWVRGVIFGILGRTDRVDDVAQQAWTSIWERIGELRNPAVWRPWMYRIVRNAAIDAGREASRRKRHTQACSRLEAGVRTTDQPVAALAANERESRMLRAIEALPALYREPFVLRHLNGWGYKEIGEVLNMPVDSVETRLVRARRLLSEALKDEV